MSGEKSNGVGMRPERADDAREALVRAGAELAAAGLSPGTSGNISIRDGDRVYMSPTGVPLGSLHAHELAVLDLDAPVSSASFDARATSADIGAPASSAHIDGPAPSKEFPLHRAFYRRERSVTAVVHLHSPHAAAYSCLAPWSERSAIPPVTPYFVMRAGQTPLIPYAAPGSVEQADALESLAFPFRSALLANHGPIVAGATMEQAVGAAVEVEEVTRILLLLGSTSPRLLTERDAIELAERYGSPWTS